MVHCCCILHNNLLALKDETLDDIFQECNIYIESEDDEKDNVGNNANLPKTMEILTEERTLLEEKVTREATLNYLVCLQNAHFRRQNGA